MLPILFTNGAFLFSSVLTVFRICARELQNPQCMTAFCILKLARGSHSFVLGYNFLLKKISGELYSETMGDKKQRKLIRSTTKL